MSDSVPEVDSDFLDAVKGLLRGDFSRLEPHFVLAPAESGARPRIIEWHELGLFADEPKAVAEALSCACFLGALDVAEFLIAKGVAPTAGCATGLNAFHWAVNRGQLETVRFLIKQKSPLETLSMHGGTMLGTAVWSAIKEPRPDHLAIIEDLLNAGARIEAAGYPTGHEALDALLKSRLPG